MSPTWNPESEEGVVTEVLVRFLPAGGNPVAGHRLDHHDAQGEASLHRFLVVEDRLARLGGVFGSEPLLLVFLKTAKLIPGNVPSIISWVAGWMLVTLEVGVLEAGNDAPHLSKSVIKQLQNYAYTI